MIIKESNTIYDVARLAGVSPSTVSRVMRGSNYPVKDETRERVLQAAKQLIYLPEQRNRKKKQVYEEIAIIIPSITNPYYSLLLEGVKKGLSRRQRCIYICDTDGDIEQEKLYIESLKYNYIKGALISSVARDYDHIRSLIQFGIELVFFDQKVDMECNKIVFNYEKGGFIATEHLISLGHERIAFFGLPLTRESRISIFNGYKACLEHYRIKYDKNLVKIPEPNISLSIEGYAEMLIKETLTNNSLPTAIFCVNDLLAVWVMHGLEKRGINVPQDISIMGFDNISFGEFLKPQLSTIDQCAYEMGMVAAEMLVGRFKDNKRNYVTISMEPKLIKRGSTSPLNSKPG